MPAPEKIKQLATNFREQLEQLKQISHNSAFLFPHRSDFNKAMSNNTMLYALYRMGYHNRATMHGFRATASTILNENGFNSDIIERQLSHGERNKVRASYNHAEYLQERANMMQWYADFIETKHNERLYA